MTAPTSGVSEYVGRMLLVGLVHLAILGSSSLEAQPSGVSSTRHNLSVSGPGEVKSQTETEVCKFCHIPHSAVAPQALWGHELPEAGQYRVPRIRRGTRGGEPAPQPDGSSRMCLSCHDGTVALGKIAGNVKPIPMTGGQRLRPGQRGYIGTDLSGSHPISFEVPDGDSLQSDGSRDIGLKPLGVVEVSGGVRLDKNRKMQCTTCHDPHSDRYYQQGKVPHFWVKPTLEEVCLSCHVLR